VRESERIKCQRLLSAFENNYRLTRLYSRYLENCPDLITKEMVDRLTEDGSLDRREAIIGLLTEIFSLDYSDPSDRTLIRSHLPRSVRLLDAKKYYNDPYYKNIKIKNKKLGNWELKTESYKPYRAVICDDMTLYEDLCEVAPLGFFEEEFFFPAVLEDSNEWMTLTPVDLDTCAEAIEKASGRVVTFGLGLGYYAYMCSEKPEVESITVVEKSEKVIKLFKEEILPQFSHPEKVNIVNKDAFLYAEFDMPKENFDLAFVDTWRDASDGLPMYEKMKPLEALSPNTGFLYWIEGFILSRKRSLLIGELAELIENDLDGAPEDYQALLDKLFIKNT